MGYDVRIRPMLCIQGNQPFDDQDYLFEPKWDGYRAIVYLSKGVSIQSRNLRDITAGFPELWEMRKALVGSNAAVLDGEIVCMVNGRPSFHALERRQVPASYVAFDILFDGDKNLMTYPLLERKQLLVSRVVESHGLAVNKYVEAQGRMLFDAACQLGFEGIVAKHKVSPYLPGKRSGWWIKIKRKVTLDCVIGGLTLDSQGRLSSLALGAFVQGRLRYLGNVGSGLGREAQRQVLEKAKAAPECRFDLELSRVPERVLKNTVWIEPTLCCEVTFAEFTPQGRLRQPVLSRLREDKSPEECRV
ncbi:MAG: non-homologous end-joining DNA ligase [Bacillota bacterium]